MDVIHSQCHDISISEIVVGMRAFCARDNCLVNRRFEPNFSSSKHKKNSHFIKLVDALFQPTSFKMPTFEPKMLGILLFFLFIIE